MKIRVGLKNFVVAELTKDESAAMAAEGAAAVEYGKLTHLEGVQQIELTPRTQQQSVDADDNTTILQQCTGYDGTAQRTMFTPEEAAMLLGEKKLEDGTVASRDTDEAPEFAAGFQCKVSGGKGKEGKILAMWLCRVKFSQGSVTASTAGAETLNPQSDTLSFKSLSRYADGAWRLYKLVDTDEEAQEFLKEDTLKKLVTDAPVI